MRVPPSPPAFTDIVFTATDADTIKTYVRLGIGVGIIASMAHTEADTDLVAIDASHLFKSSTTQIAFKHSTFLPHLTRSLVEKAERLRDRNSVQKLFEKIALEVR